MTPRPLAPRPGVDHQLVVTTLAFLALDRPDFADVLQSLVVTLYGARGTALFQDVRAQFDAAQPHADGGRLYRSRVRGPRDADVTP